MYPFHEGCPKKTIPTIVIIEYVHFGFILESSTSSKSDKNSFNLVSSHFIVE